MNLVVKTIGKLRVIMEVVMVDEISGIEVPPEGMELIVNFITSQVERID